MQREILRQQHRRKFKRMLLGIVLLLIIILGILLFRAQRPMSRAKSQSIKIARKSGIQFVDKFYMSELNQTYYTVKGTNAHNAPLYVIINKDDGKVTVLNANQGITQEQAITQVKQQAKRILNAAPSMFNGRPVWIISYLNQSSKLCYATLAYQNGKIIQSISNI